MSGEPVLDQCTEDAAMFDGKDGTRTEEGSEESSECILHTDKAHDLGLRDARGLFSMIV